MFPMNSESSAISKCEYQASIAPPSSAEFSKNNDDVIATLENEDSIAPPYCVYRLRDMNKLGVKSKEDEC